MTLTPSQPSFAAGEIAPELFGRVDLAKYQSALQRAENLFVRPHGGIVNRPGTRFVCEAIDSAVAGRLIPFSFSTEQTYILELGDGCMRVILDGGLALESSQPVEAISLAAPAVLQVTAHGLSEGDEVMITGGAGMREITGAVLVVRNPTSDSFQVSRKDSVVGIDTTAYSAYAGGAQVARVYRLTLPYAAEDLAGLSWIQSADVMYLVHPGYDVRKLSRTGHTAWSIETVDFQPGIAAPANVTVTATYDTAGTDTDYSYKVTAIDDETGEESLPSAADSDTNDLSLAGNLNTIAWDAVTGAGRYEIYKEDNGIYGYIGGTEATSFEDKNVTPDLSSTPPKAKNPFSGAKAKPSTATFFEQRLVFAASTAKPQTIWFSTTANFENFGTRSIVQDDDAVTITLVARQVNAVRHLVAKEDLWALTSGGEWRIRGGGDVDFITPSSVTTKKVSSWGASRVPPLEVGSSVLYVVEKGQGVRDLFNQIALTEYDSEEGSDLSILAPHLFEGREVKAWAYAQTPHSLIWVVMDDGSLLSFCYYREHRVFAWTRHSSESLNEGDGRFEEVAVISEGDEDLPYFLVTRTVGGETRRYIERLPKRRTDSAEEAFFLDSGLSYEGLPVSRFFGLDHLEGRQVSALADGQVLRDLTVEAGAVTLPNPAAQVHVGLAYESRLQTLPLALNLSNGSAAGRSKRLVKVMARVRRTRGLWAGPALARLNEYRQGGREAWGDAIPLADGLFELEVPAEWNREGSLWIVQKDPLPMELLALTPDYGLGR